MCSSDLLSGVAGLDYELPIFFGTLYLDLRFMMDITNLSSAANTNMRRIRLTPSIGYAILLQIFVRCAINKKVLGTHVR